MGRMKASSSAAAALPLLLLLSLLLAATGADAQSADKLQVDLDSPGE